MAPTSMVQEEENLRGQGQCRGFENDKIMSLGGTLYSPVQKILLHLTTIHFVTERQMDRQIHDNTMKIANKN